MGYRAAGGRGGEVGMPQNIMRMLSAVIWPDRFKFASYGPVRGCLVCMGANYSDFIVLLYMHYEQYIIM